MSSTFSKGEHPYMRKYRRQPSDQTSVRSSMLQREGTSNSSGARYGALLCASASSCTSSACRRSCTSTLAGRVLPKSWKGTMSSHQTLLAHNVHLLTEQHASWCT